MAGGDRRLSDLPDDVLLRVLYFAPAKEAASTSALARRWRSLWRSSGAVNLVTRIYDRESGAGSGLASRDAEAALGLAAAAAADDEGSRRRGGRRSPVRRLTLQAEAPADQYNAPEVFQPYYALLSGPAARGVEELSVDTYGAGRRHYYGVYRLSTAALPSETLRVLHISNCAQLTPPPPPGAAAAFPQLEALRLHHCGPAMSLLHLQRIIDAAPRLATLQLDSVMFDARSAGSPPSLTLRARLRCPAVTALVLANCKQERYDQPGSSSSMELDAPMLRCFRYEGAVEKLSLKSPATGTASVELKLRRAQRRDQNHDERHRLFWQFLHSFIDARVLKLRVKHLDDIAVAVAVEKAELLGDELFRNLQRLELDALLHTLTDMAAAGALIANFLHCCPAIRVLRLNLITAGSYFEMKGDEQDFGKSVDHFMSRRRLKPAISLDDDDHEDQVSDIPGLSEHSFSCLQSSLRYVSLRFRMEENMNSFGVRLAKFFAENAMLLEEICIDNGNKRVREHINHKVGRWIANSSKRRNSANSTGVAVLPLERTW